MAAALAALLGAAGCRTPEAGGGPERKEMPERPIEEVLAAHATDLMGIPGVVAVYQGALADGTPCVTVGVAERTPETERRIPRTLEGHPVVVRETGPIAPR